MTIELAWWACCEHCGCDDDDRTGHDDTCEHGCNDTPDECQHNVVTHVGYTRTGIELECNTCGTLLETT